ncbi:MAG: hypothetical protein A3F73_04735 [Gallionellales bacterium RIFCSPLOWO2_12_FULL_59_22]|nr:MAG: hypothetical protein A3H99_00320 [Gallionellales bacterium RIFCSPLOWO2_02_FULL_59_110]OGT14284.1 MAG: hypothetical protein A3F73_04735 [Gallionellales bacterium RIFCSPLOWO2_12_FULL_59_22]
MKLITALMLLCAATAASATPFPDGDARTGEQLFEQHKCGGCHAKKMGGDGSAIFTRLNRKVNSAAQLVDHIHICGGVVDANLAPQDKQHLGAYLNRFYNLK